MPSDGRIAPTRIIITCWGPAVWSVVTQQAALTSTLRVHPSSKRRDSTSISRSQSRSCCMVRLLITSTLCSCFSSHGLPTRYRRESRIRFAVQMRPMTAMTPWLMVSISPGERTQCTHPLGYWGAQSVFLPAQLPTITHTWPHVFCLPS